MRPHNPANCRIRASASKKQLTKMTKQYRSNRKTTYYCHFEIKLAGYSNTLSNRSTEP